MDNVDMDDLVWLTGDVMSHVDMDNLGGGNTNNLGSYSSLATFTTTSSDLCVVSLTSFFDDQSFFVVPFGQVDR